MDTLKQSISNKEVTLKAIIFVGIFIVSFLISLFLWPAIIFRALGDIQMSDIWINIQSKSFKRLLFGPVTPFGWQIKQLLKFIDHYGLSGILVFFESTSFIHIIGGPLYLYGVYRTGKIYIFSQIKWSNWRIIILTILFGLTWFFWGESHISFGV